MKEGAGDWPPAGDGEARGDVERSVSDGATYVHGGHGEPAGSPSQATPSGVGRGRRGSRGGAEERMVGREQPTTYYGRPIVKPPVWKPEIPFYFFSGGLAGASAVLAAGATFAGRPVLARRAWAGAFAGVTVSPVLLIKDLGKPSRFINMLRVFKPTSPMNLGAWLLAANGGATTLCAGLNLLRPGRRGGAPELAAAALGAPLATYTAVLVSNSAIPAWSEARWELPLVFAASASASAAGAAAITVPTVEAGPARRLGIAAAIAEEAATVIMHRRLGALASSYEEGPAGRFGKAARALTLSGALALGAAGEGRLSPVSSRRGGRRMLSAAGGALLLAGAVCKRWSVFKAGFHSAEDPAQTVNTQRA
ncbi:MAG TPA: NrfD/PsrC family molybdoenzyme membrane anchor subunit [Solirubrobacterales bacterium]|jgi:formate-dependent nitrite reductase membrane component NrfD